ncbi:MAG: YihY/virulence factor BrkB family protein, partial [Chloroflexota bacterium]|nr:YihY/virulence factor BrkB family protein [Chloroflexota bacterium]
MTIAGVEVWATAKRIFAAFRKEDLQGLAAEVAYHFLFSVVPLLIFLTALSGFISDAIGTRDAVQGITEWLFENLPASTATAVREPLIDVVSNRSGSLLSFGGLLALWGGKNAIGALIKALNAAFDVKETRSWVRRQVISIGLTIALGLAIIAASSFFLAGSFIGEGVAGWLGFGDVWTVTWAILRWPAILALLIGALAFLYWAGPNVDTS